MTPWQFTETKIQNEIEPMTLLRLLKALYLPFAVMTVAIVAIPLVATLAIEAIEAAEVRMAQVEPSSPATTTPLPATAATTPVDADPTCEISDTTRNELCAQWKAADAATNAVYIGWGQLVVSAVTLLAAFAAALYARGAAREAASANSIAKNTDRPWVFVEARLNSRVGYAADQIILPIEIDLRNDGNTPAIDVRIEWDAFQINLPDLELEYKRIISKPESMDSTHIEPFRYKEEVRWNQYVTLDRRNDGAPTIVAITVFYRSPHSEDQLHTSAFYFPNTSPVPGKADRFHKSRNGTRMV